MSSVLFIKFAILMTIALLSVYAGSLIGGGPLPILLALAASFTSLIFIRNADRIALSSPRIGSEGLYSMALRDARGVKHLRNVDVIKTARGYVAVAGLEVVDTWNSYEVLDERLVNNLVQLHGEALGSVGGVYVQLEIIKREGDDPLIRYLVYARARDERAAASRAETTVEELSQMLSSLQIALRRAECHGSPESCELTRLASRRVRGMPSSGAPGAVQIALALSALGFASALSPGVLPLVAAVSAPAAVAGGYVIATAHRMGRGGAVAATNGSEARLEDGRLLIGRTYNSFATLRYVQHYDRVLNPEDVARLVEELNDFLYNAGSYHIRLCFRRADETGFQRKESLRMDMSHLDFETGGGLSKRIKAHKHEIHLERMRALGEKPFELYGVFILKSPEGGEAARVREDAFRSRLGILGFRVGWVRNPIGIARCVRMLYIGPSTGMPLIEPPSTEDVKALTLDFSWVSPIALDRAPLLMRQGIYLGHDRRGRPVLWNPAALRNAHIGLFGPPGSGKSTIVKTLILRTAKHYRETRGYTPVFLIIDPAGEYRKIARSLGGVIIDMTERKVNPLLLSGASPHERASKVAEMFRYILALKGEEKAELKDAILEAYRRAGIDPVDRRTWRLGHDRDVTMATVYRIVGERLAEVQRTRDPMLPVLKALYDKLRDVCEGARALDRTDATVDEILERGGILCLSFKDEFGEIGLDMQRIIVWTLLEQLRDKLLSMEVEEELRVMVIVDEGHRFVQLATMVEGGIQVVLEPPLSLHLRDTRKFGASYVFVTHLPKDMPRGVTELLGTVVAMSATNVDYLKWAAEELRLTPAQVSTLERAGVGRGYIIWLDDPRPLFMTFEPEKEALVRDAHEIRRRALAGVEEARPRAVEARAKMQGPEAGVEEVKHPEKTISAPRTQAGGDETHRVVSQLVARISSGQSLENKGSAGASRRRYCRFCGKPNPARARFCGNCANPMDGGGSG